MKNILLHLSVLLVLISFGTNLQAQSKTADLQQIVVSAIPDTLIKNANAVVRYDETTFSYDTPIYAEELHKLVITVLNESGKEFAEFEYPGDKFRKLTAFSAKIYNSQGAELKKYKMQDIRTTEYSEALASDSKTYWLSPDIPTYPFTIVFEYEINWNNGINSFPVFFPQIGYDLSVEKSCYFLIVPEETKIAHMSFNMADDPKVSTEKGELKYTWELNGLKAIKDEPLDGSLVNYIPRLYIKPLDFVYDGVSGNISGWSEMGQWSYSLIKDQGELPENAKAKVLELISGANSDREKVEALYKYLGSTTRYVSIQLGIGGYKPMPAAEVFKTGFGDCKALSNYMKSLLAAAGLQSYYTLIRLDDDDRDLFNDFPSFHQFNHAILMVPLQKDTLWLECTNPEFPLGFVHNGISGHEALIVSEDGGKVVRLPDYSDSLNVESNVVNVSLAAEGGARIDAKKSCFVKIYDDYAGFSKLKFSDQAEHLTGIIKIPNVVMEKIMVNEVKLPLPYIDISYIWNTRQYGSKSGTRLFIPVNPYRNTFESVNVSERTHGIDIQQGFKDIDTIVVNIPAGYEIESMPSGVEAKTSFGCFRSSCLKDGQTIKIIHSFYMPSGRYALGQYGDFLKFLEVVNTAYKGKIVLKKN